jgi:GT2 family glycosyltransferase
MSVRHLAGAAGPPDGAYDADVVILSLDRPEETSAAIRSALAQTGVSRHVFIVDQGSRPETLACLVGVVATRSDATLVTLGCNHGVAGGRNHGTRLGHGRVIVGLDNDAEFADAQTLARAVAAVDCDPALAAVGCRIVLHATGADDLSSWGYPLSLLRRAGEAFDAATFVGAGHAIRRAAWDACGGYDAALFFCWEEYDFCLRAIERGWRIRYRGDIAIRHKVSPEQRCAWSGTRWFYYVRNRLYIGRKWGNSWPSLAPRIAGYLLKGARNRAPADAACPVRRGRHVGAGGAAAAVGRRARLSARSRHGASRLGVGSAAPRGACHAAAAGGPGIRPTGPPTGLLTQRHRPPASASVPFRSANNPTPGCPRRGRPRSRSSRTPSGSAGCR